MKKDRIKCLGKKFLDIVECQISGDLKNVDADELGEVVDMAKDCAEMLKYLEEANYYSHITDAMEESSNEEAIEKMNMYDKNMNYARSRMYYSNGLEGDAGKARKEYMEMKKTTSDSSKLMTALTHYSETMLDDIDEALEGASEGEIKLVKTHLTNYINSI